MNLPPLLRNFLWPFSSLYGVAVRARVWLYQKGWLKQHHLKATVVSVGNLTVGGTGKTPMILWLAEKFLSEGKRVAILSRGYRGSNGTSDEIELMNFRLQGRVAFGVGKNRYAEGQRIGSQQPIDIFLLDDGFQHLQLARDVDILLVDASRPIHAERLLPAGRLREPVSAMSRANLVVFTRTETVPGTLEAVEKLSQFPVFAATTRLLGFRQLGAAIQVLPTEQIGQGPFFAFCGLGNPEAFFCDLRNWGFTICGQAVFPDHHRYTDRDVSMMKQAGNKSGANAFITTEKDAQNLSRVRFEDSLVYVSMIEMAVRPEADFHRTLDQMLAASVGAAA